MANNTRLQKQAQKLAMAAMGQYGAIPAATPAAAPDPAMYGVFGPAYAHSLETDMSDRQGDRYALSVESDLENKRYAQALKDGYLGQLGVTQATAKGATGKALAEQLGTMAKYGLIGAVNANGGGSLDVDPVSAMTSNATSLNERNAGIRKDNAAARKDDYAAGIAHTPDSAAAMDTPTNQTEANPGYGLITGSNATYSDVTDRQKAEAEAANGAVNAKAAMVRANKPGSDGSTITIATTTQDPDGNPIVTTRRSKGNAVPDPAPPSVNILQRVIADNAANGGTSQNHGSFITLISRDGRRQKRDLHGNIIP